MMYHLFLNLFGKVAKKDKMSDQNPRGAENKFPQCIELPQPLTTSLRINNKNHNSK